MQPKNDLTAEYVRELLSYEPEAGEFRWKVRRGGTARAGDVAGYDNDKGYRRIQLAGRLHLAHRLAWLITHGRWPSADIDHIDGNPANNAISNLREASRAENRQNLKRATKTSKTGVLGVSPYGRKWHAQIQTSGKVRHLGFFATIEEAAEVYRQAKREAHPFWHEAPKQHTEHRYL